MPCRAPKIAASTPQTLSNLWITDDILSEAFNRFLRVSHTHRRFGSNIPGPLEARRRLAKRRLGLSAVPSGGAPASHDFGGLFGLGVVKPPEFEKGWQWEAPLPVRRREQVEVKRQVEWGLPLFDGSLEQSVESEDTRARVDKFLEVPEDPVVASTNTFTRLLGAQEYISRVDVEHLQPFVSFLESSENEPEAQLTLQLVQWLAEREPTKQAMDSILSLIRQKITLHTISREEQSVILNSLTQTGYLREAYRLFMYSQTLSLRDHPELTLRLIQTQQLNSNKIWHLFDHRARETSGIPNKRHIYPHPLSQDLVDIVHETAYAFSRSPHLRARVAYRRVWECYRFLIENNARLTPLMSRALVRAGIANFVRARMPIPKSRVRHLLALVGQIEGKEVKKEVDRLVFGYWLGNRNLTRYKPTGRAMREKFLGEQTMEDGSVRRVRWRGRVLRESVEMRMRGQEEQGRKVNEEVKDVIDDEEQQTDIDPGPHVPISEGDESKHPILETAGRQKLLDIDSKPTDPVKVPTRALESQNGPASATEVEELPTLDPEHWCVTGSEAPSEHWTSFTTERLDSLVQDSSISSRPYGAAESGFMVESSSSDVSVLPPEAEELEVRTGGAIYAPPVKNSTRVSVNDKNVTLLQESATNRKRKLDTHESISAQSQTTDLHPWTAVLLDEGHGVTSPPALMSFHSPSFRRLYGWYNHGEQPSYVAGEVYRDPNAEIELVRDGSADMRRLRLSAPGALNRDLKSLSLQSAGLILESKAAVDSAAKADGHGGGVSSEISARRERLLTFARGRRKLRRKARSKEEQRPAILPATAGEITAASNELKSSLRPFLKFYPANHSADERSESSMATWRHSWQSKNKDEVDYKKLEDLQLTRRTDWQSFYDGWAEKREQRRANRVQRPR